jgi:hypothetical protein
MKVLILRKENGWELSINSWDHGLLNSWTCPKLIDIIDMANILKIHIDNVDELPLNQYVIQE